MASKQLRPFDRIMAQFGFTVENVVARYLEAFGTRHKLKRQEGLDRTSSPFHGERGGQKCILAHIFAIGAVSMGRHRA